MSESQYGMSHGDYEDLFGLTKEQKLAVRSLERAFKKCNDANVIIANIYGDLLAYNGRYVKKIIDEPDDPPLSKDLGDSVNSIYDLCSWADDQHYIHLTDAGKKQLRDRVDDESNF